MLLTREEAQESVSSREETLSGGSVRGLVDIHHQRSGRRGVLQIKIMKPSSELYAKLCPRIFKTFAVRYGEGKRVTQLAMSIGQSKVVFSTCRHYFRFSEC